MQKTRDSRTFLAWLLAALAALALLLGYLHFYGDSWLSSDDSSEMILSHILAGEGGILTENWHYSTELRVLNTQLVWSALFRLSDRWHLVRLAGTAVSLVALCLCIWLLCRWVGREKYTGWLCTIFLTPICPVYFIIMLFGIYYVPHVSISLLLTALFYRCTKARSRKEYMLLLIPGCVLSFLAGLGGLRQLLIWHAPALLAVALLSLSGGERPQVRRSGGFAAGAFLWAAAGYLVNSRILSERYHFLSYESIHFTDFDPERVWQTVIDWMKLYGYRSGGKVFSVDLFFNGAFAVTVLLIVGSAIAVLRRKESYGPGERLIVWYYVSALLILLLLYGFSDMEYADRYSIPLTVFGFVVVLLGCTDGADGAKGRAALLVLAVLIGIQGVGFYRTYSGERGGIRDEIVAGESYGSWGRKATSRSLLCRQLVTEGYTQGVATFWNSNVLTELSGGAIEMWTIQNLNDGEARIFRWLQQTDHDTRRPEGKVFLIAGGSMDVGEPTAELVAGAEKVFHSGEYTAYCYASWQELESLLGADA